LWPNTRFALALTLALAPQAGHAETLADAVAAAYQSNPTLQQQRASLRSLDETYVQAEAGYYPTVSLNTTITTDTNNAQTALQNLPGIDQQLVPGQSQTSAAGIQINQAIYTGGRVARAVDASHAGIMAGREALRSTEESVLQATIQAYVDTRRDQQALAIAMDNLNLLRGQLDEARARFGVGEITRTDVAETEANVAAAEANLAAAQTALANSRAAYAAIVGHEPGDLAPEPPLTRLLPGTLDEAVEAARRRSPDILRSAYTADASAAREAEVKALTRPTLSLQANLGYVGGSLGLHTPFSHYSHDITASAVATFPIFSGGVTSSQIRQAAETNAADQIGIEVARRQAFYSVSQAWNQLQGARASQAAEKAQEKAAALAFEGMRIESRAGQRSILDVLITQQSLTNARIALVSAGHDEYLAAANLLAAMGALNAADLAPGTPVYDPTRNFDRVGRGPFWAPWEPAIATIDRIGAPAR
jgi:outer membrane protein